MIALYWFTAFASLLGVWLNIKRNVACFYIWTATNGIWAVADATHGLLPQAALQLAYLALAIYGIVKWSRRKKDKEK